MAHTGACIVLLRLPSLKSGFRRSLASFDFTKMKRAGEQFALVGPILEDIEKPMQESVRHVLLLPFVVRAGVEKKLLQCGFVDGLRHEGPPEERVARS